MSQILDFDKLLQERRSVRVYSDRLVEKETIQDIVRAGLLAPSPSSQYPIRVLHLKSTHFFQQLKESLDQRKEELVAQALLNKEKGKKLRNQIQYYWRHCQTIFTSPTVLLVSMTNLEGFSSKLYESGLISDNDQSVRNSLLGAGLFIQNMLLKAQSMGVASCVVTAPFSLLTQDFFKQIDPLSPIAFITLGYSAENLSNRTQQDLFSFFGEL